MSRAVVCGLTTPPSNEEVVACHLALEPCSKGALVSWYSWGVRSTWLATLEKLSSLETSIASTHHAPCVEVCDSQKSHNVMTTSVTTIFFFINPTSLCWPPPPNDLASRLIQHVSCWKFVNVAIDCYGYIVGYWRTLTYNMNFGKAHR